MKSHPFCAWAVIIGNNLCGAASEFATQAGHIATQMQKLCALGLVGLAYSLGIKFKVFLYLKRKRKNSQNCYHMQNLNSRGEIIKRREMCVAYISLFSLHSKDSTANSYNLNWHGCLKIFLIASF